MPVIAFYDDGVAVNSIVMDFDFSEYDENGEVVNERGVIAGAGVELGKAFGALWLSTKGSIIKGLTVYDGQTQSGIPHKTNTDQTVYDYSFQVGRIYQSWRRHDYAILYAGLGFHQWTRDIKTRNNVQGLYERYSWLYAHVGARGFLYSTERMHLMVELNLLRTINPVMDVSFKGQHDNTRVSLGEHYGAKLSIPFHFSITRRFIVYADIFFEAWDLGQSKVVDLTSDGFVSGGLQEPRSTSRFKGAEIGFLLRFE